MGRARLSQLLKTFTAEDAEGEREEKPAQECRFETGSRPVGGAMRSGGAGTAELQLGRAGPDGLQRMRTGTEAERCRAGRGWKPPVRNRRLAGETGSKPVGGGGAGGAGIAEPQLGLAWPNR